MFAAFAERLPIYCPALDRSQKAFPYNFEAPAGGLTVPIGTLAVASSLYKLRVSEQKTILHRLNALAAHAFALDLSKRGLRPSG
jgi:hypothetical protein